LLKDAVYAAEVERVISFFRGFLGEAGAARQASVDRARSAPSRQRTYTRREIERLSNEYRRGRISEEQYARISADIVAAGREGRIVDAGVYLTK
jgi:hypothetical protein